VMMAGGGVIWSLLIGVFTTPHAGFLVRMLDS
jgi:hypothetical protein